MTDSNRPSAYAVYDTKHKRVIRYFDTMRDATNHCESLEPESWTGYRYVVMPVRPADALK